jgi:hypothetical protein
VAARREVPPGGRGECVVTSEPELGPVAAGLLEVVPDDLVQVDERSPVLLEPGGEASVQLDARRLRESVVCRVADEEVPEPKRVLTRKLRRVGRDELPAHQRGQVPRHVCLRGGERLHGAAVEDFALDRRSLEHASLGRVQPIQTRLQERA